jgi:uncharacterized protein YhbP (UPF0306 family)
MPIRRTLQPIARRRIEEAAAALLDAAPLCAISTISPRGAAHVHTAYFAWTAAFEIVWLSSPSARHSRNIADRPTTAIAVYASAQQWGRPDRGIQLFGSSSRLSDSAAREAERCYARRFPTFESAGRGDYAFYRFHARRVKLFDEGLFGGGTFVTARVEGGRVGWERTEISSSKG